MAGLSLPVVRGNVRCSCFVDRIRWTLPCAWCALSTLHQEKCPNYSFYVCGVHRTRLRLLEMIMLRLWRMEVAALSGRRPLSRPSRTSGARSRPRRSETLFSLRWCTRCNHLLLDHVDAMLRKCDGLMVLRTMSQHPVVNVPEVWQFDVARWMWIEGEGSVQQHQPSTSPSLAQWSGISSLLHPWVPGILWRKQAISKIP